MVGNVTIKYVNKDGVVYWACYRASAKSKSWIIRKAIRYFNADYQGKGYKVIKAHIED